MFALFEPGFLQQSQWDRAAALGPGPVLVAQHRRALEPAAITPTGDRQPSRSRAIAPHTPIRSVSDLASIQPTDWAFRVLHSLQQRLGADVLAEGRSPLTRYEFAIALRTLLERASAREIRSLKPADLEIIQRLQADFAQELALLGGVNLNRLETRVEALEEQEFSPTTRFSGEVILGLTGTFGNEIDESEIVFQQRIGLNLTASFTGNDRLRIGLRVGNFEEPSIFDDLTNEGRLGFRTDTGNDIEISSLNYRFPIGDRLRVFIAPRGDNISALNPPFRSRGTGAISRFGRGNPIYRLIGDGGIGLTYSPNDILTLDVGYFAGDPDDPEPGNGLFNGDNSISARLEIEPSDRLAFALLYIRSFNDSDLETGTGSLRSQIDLDRPVIGNSYSFEFSYRFNSGLTLGGWVGFTDANVLGLGEASVLNYALTVAIPNLGKEGNLFGLIIGQEPRLIGTSGFEIDGSTSDRDLSLHVEALYRHQITNDISVTPGIIWITAPNGDSANSDIAVFTVRTTFRF